MIHRTWREFTVNPEAITSAFSEVDPSLNDVRLISAELSEDGPTLYLTLALNDYPANPPGRWKRGTSNAVSIQLQCLGLISLSLNRLSGDSTISCEIGKVADDALQIQIAGCATNGLVHCSFIRINHITPYFRDDLAPA
jgi:hypothetical protein